MRTFIAVATFVLFYHFGITEIDPLFTMLLSLSFAGCIVQDALEVFRD